MAFLRRREIYIAITFIVGILMVFDFFLNIGFLNQSAATLRDWVVILSYFAIVVGMVNLYIFHSRKIMEKNSQWGFSAWLILITSIVILIGVFSGVGHPVYSFLFKNVYGALGPSGYGIMAFFIASAAFRALRVRNIESLVLVTAVVFTLLYRAPVGGIIPFVPAIGVWIQKVPNTGGMRGIIIGLAIGAIGMGIRTLIGRERGYLPE
jgi:hypothetical protein